MRKLLIVVALLFLYSPCAKAIPAIVQNGKECNASTSTNSCAFTSSTTAGSLLIGFTVKAGTCATDTINDTGTQSNTWQDVGPVTNSPTATHYWYAMNTVGGPETVNYVCGTATNTNLRIVEVSGVALTSAVDGAGCSDNTQINGASSDTCNLTTTVANDIVVVFITDSRAAHIYVVGSGYTAQTDSLTTQLASESQVFAGTGSQTANWTWSANLGTENVVLYAVAFKPPTVAGGGSIVKGPAKVTGPTVIH
jgi:hypothetical protein